MDLLEAKSRIAEALVESIFRRARYQLTRFHSEQVPLRFGREDFSPDFLARPDPGGGDAQPILVEVKYRPHVDQFISVENQRGDRSVFLMARRQWPKLYFVLVTDHPEPERSRFQALSLGDYTPGAPFKTVDLTEMPELGLFRNNVEDHEVLADSIFELLGA
jgi:hypothetical protein